MKKQPWWQACTCYQIYLPSFCDGNNDGLGDFPGLISRLDYLQALGIGAVWITPFYPSPLVDNGYDISDYCAVDARFGTLDDFRRVVDGCHARGIRVIIESGGQSRLLRTSLVLRCVESSGQPLS